MPAVPKLTLALRRILRGSDRARAVRAERAAEAAHFAPVREEAMRIRAAYGATGPSAVVLGTAVHGGEKVAISERALAGHALLVGPSGAGKSRFATLLYLALLEHGLRRAVVLDPKAELVELCRAALVTLGRDLSAARRAALYRSVVQVDLFGSNTLPRLGILAPQPGLDPETHAFEVATLLTSELDQGVGVRQEAVLHRTIECLIRAALPITVLPAVMEAPVVLDRMAETHGHGELFRTTAARLRRESKDRVLGLQSRAERVLRLKATRLALGADRCLDAADLLDQLALVSLAAPQGAVDVSRMLSGLLWLLLSQAIRRRANGSPRSHLIIDELPTFLMAGGPHMADGLEDLLRLARSKGVFMTGLAQEMASLSKVSSSLPDVVRSNVHLFGIFRSVADASWDFALPISGRRPKPKAAPWDREHGGFLERGAETTLLRSTLARLPDRELFFVDRRTGLPSTHLRTADVHLEATDDERAELDDVGRAHPMLAPIAELERVEADVKGRLAELLGTAERRSDPAEVPSIRRATGRLGIG